MSSNVRKPNTRKRKVATFATPRQVTPLVRGDSCKVDPIGTMQFYWHYKIIIFRKMSVLHAEGCRGAFGYNQITKWPHDACFD